VSRAQPAEGVLGLNAEEIAELQEAARYRSLDHAPVLGFWLQSLRWARVARKVHDRVSNVLLARPRPDAGRWGGGDRQRVAEAVLQTAVHRMRWPNDHFSPEDSVQILLWSGRDWMEFDLALLDIARKLGISISEKERGDLAEWLWRDQPTLAEFVDLLCGS
jgi:hypothetical protein